ncbi:MAG: hypothetical protein ACHQ4J_01950 [Candidatus Binatia bacterium]
MGRTPGQRQLKRRSDHKLDVGRALELRLERGLSYEAIGQLCGGVTKQAVALALKPFRQLLDHPDSVRAYATHEPRLLDAARMTLLANMLDPARLQKAPPNHLAYTFSQLFQAGRLLRGQSTSNIGLRSTVILSAHAVPAREPTEPSKAHGLLTETEPLASSPAKDSDSLAAVPGALDTKRPAPARRRHGLREPGGIRPRSVVRPSGGQ